LYSVFFPLKKHAVISMLKRTMLTEKPPSVLIIDDEVNVREAIRCALLEEGYEIFQAENGRQGLVIYAEESPEVVILDINMPMMDGFGFLGGIDAGKDPYNSSTVIVLTGHGDNKERQRCYQYGVSAFLNKPCNFYELHGMVRMAVQTKRMHRELVEYRDQLEEKVAERTEALHRYQYHLEELVKERTEDLQQTKAYTESILSSMFTMVLVVDSTGIIKQVNPAVCSLLGYTNEALLGHSIEKIVKHAESHAETMPEGVMQFLQLGGREQLWYAKDGQEVWVNSTISSMEDDLDNHLGLLVCVAQDITEQKRLEADQQYRAFQSGVAEMSVAILHNIGNALTGMSYRSRLLEKGMDELTRIANLVSKVPEKTQQKLASGISQDLLLAQLLEVMENIAKRLNMVLDKRLCEQVDLVADGIKHISEIIRIQQGFAKPADSLSEFNLRHLFEHAITLQATVLDKYEVVVNIDMPVMKEVCLPRNQLMQLIMNLLKNGREAIVSRREQQSDFDGGTITINARIRQKKLYIHVEDDGCGLAVGQLTEIFHYGYTTKKRGTGYGLHSSANFVNARNGSIVAKSAGANQGAVFSIRLPLESQLKPK